MRCVCVCLSVSVHVCHGKYTRKLEGKIYVKNAGTEWIKWYTIRVLYWVRHFGVLGPPPTFKIWGGGKNLAEDLVLRNFFPTAQRKRSLRSRWGLRPQTPAPAASYLPLYAHFALFLNFIPSPPILFPA